MAPVWVLCIFVFFVENTGAQLSPAVQQAFVDAHNKFRAQVATGQTNQPGASNMQAVAWSDDVASVAQAWADQSACFDALTHNEKRYGGENAAGSSVPITNDQSRIDAANQAVEGWFSEISQYNYPDGYSDATGHYTQLVWARSSLIGCGISTCASSGQTVIFCDYYAAGNGGGGPYESGDACSNCPSYRNVCNNGLCTSSQTTSTGVKCVTQMGAFQMTCPPWFNTCGWRLIRQDDAGIEQIQEVGCTVQGASNCTNANQKSFEYDTYWCTCNGDLCNQCNEIWCPGFSRR